MSITATIATDERTESITVRADESLLEALQRTGWHIPAPCGGAGKCGKCRVVVDPPEAGGERTPEEERFTGPDSRQRLACCTHPVDDLTVTLPGHVAPPASADTLAKGGSIEVPVLGRPAAILERLTLPQPSLADQRSVYRRLRDASQLPELRIEHEHLVEAARAIDAASTEDRDADVDVVIDSVDGAIISLTAVQREQSEPELLGVAFDIGTTTVAGYLLDLATHEVRASRSEANAQSAYGADVISRITAYGTGSPLHDVICRQLAQMTRALAEDIDARSEEIAIASIVGNTTMIHLLLDLDPASMSRAPFMPTVSEGITLLPAQIELPIHPRGRVRILPGVSAYVGSDIVADLLSSRLHTHGGTSLLVDIGTNGEIVCGGRDGLLACSTAAGPAFEGATIRHGSGGIAGAINHVRRDDSEIVIETIRGTPPASICGTGLMDAVAMLLEDGVLDETGRLDPSGACDEASELYRTRIVDVDREPALVLAAQSSDGHESIVLTQGDIRQVQLAKGAIAAGIRVLLEEAGVRAEELSAVYLAGGFGTYVRPRAAVRVGLLPGIEADRVVALGNAAGAGAARMLVDDESGTEAASIASACRYMELSGSASFQMFYMEEMMFGRRTAR